MADSPETIIKVGADTRPAEQAADNLFSKFGGSLTEINSGIELVMKSVQLMGRTIQGALNFAKAGEEIQAIGTRFDTLAKQAGLIPENVAAGIEKAVAGTVDMEDALQAATGALVSLEVGAEKLPQLFELAKKSTALFGGEVTDRFEQITMAVASGSTRMLRSIGLVIDADKVYKDYAKTLGVMANELTQAERQQAMMNAILEKGNSSFKNVSSSITPISEGLKRLSVSFGEIGDTAKIVFNNIFGGMIQTVLSKATDYLERFNVKMKEVFLGQAPSAEYSLKRLNEQLREQQEVLAQTLQLQEQSGGGQENFISALQTQIDKTKEQLVIQQQLVNMEATKQAQQGMGIQMNKSEADSIARVTEEQKKQNKERIDAMTKAVKASIQAEQEISNQSKILGTTIKNSFVNVVSQSMQTLIGNLVKGKAAFADFGKVVLGLLGQMAIQIGTVLLTSGIGMLSLKFLDPTGAIVAGLGLIAIGSILSAIGEGGGGAGGAVGNPNAAAADAVIASGDVYEQTKEEERMTPQTGVQVVVQGNVFDSRETGLQIAQIINDSFDLNGTIIRANA